MKKKISFYADDFGYNSNINKEIIKLYHKKMIRSFSILSDYLLLTNRNLINFVKNKKAFAHINLIEGKNYDSLAIFVLKLIFGLVDLKAITSDIQRQINVLKFFKIKIIGLNSHQHTHALYPISEIFISLAKKNNISIVRSYQNLRAQTTRGRLCYFLLKTTSLLSYFRYKGRFDLPKTWKLKGNDQYYMSWEDKSFSLDKLNQNTDIIIHPGSKFDKNNNYVGYL